MFERGRRYRLHIKRDQDRTVKVVVLDYMMEEDRVWLFSARPQFGTQTIPKRWIVSSELVDSTTPIKVVG